MVYNIGKALLERLHFGAFVVFVGATEAFPLPGVILHHNAPKIVFCKTVVIIGIPGNHQACEVCPPCVYLTVILDGLDVVFLPLFDLSGAEITDVILSRDDVVIRKHFHPSLWLRLASPRSSFR